MDKGKTRGYCNDPSLSLADLMALIQLLHPSVWGTRPVGQDNVTLVSTSLPGPQLAYSDLYQLFWGQKSIRMKGVCQALAGDSKSHGCHFH